MFDSARWDEFRFRADDIVISSAPKCGTTWTQMLCALLVFQDSHFDRPLSEISPWLDQSTGKLDTVLATLDAQEHRRFIKTHTPFDGLPFDERVTYLCVARDPRDVFVSMDHHAANLDLGAALGAARSRSGTLMSTSSCRRPCSSTVPTTCNERFRAWVDNDVPPQEVTSSLRSTLHHADTFWAERDRDNVALFHYADLEADLVGELERLAAMLGIDLSRPRLGELAEAAGFDEMKRRARDLVPNLDIALFRDNDAFFRRGRSGEWRTVLGRRGPDALRRESEPVRLGSTLRRGSTTLGEGSSSARAIRDVRGGSGRRRRRRAPASARSRRGAHRPRRPLRSHARVWPPRQVTRRRGHACRSTWSTRPRRSTSKPAMSSCSR